MSSRVLSSVSRLALLATLFGCAEKQLIVDPLAVKPVAALVLPPGVSNMDFPVGSTADPGNLADLPPYADSLIAEFKLQGLISVQSDRNTAIQGYSGPLDGSGIYVESSFTACYANVTFTYRIGNTITGTSGPGPCRFTPVPQSFWVDTVLVAGQGQVRRGPGIPQFPSDCDFKACHSYAGTQSVSVTPLVAILNLTASPTQVRSGDLVFFTATATPSTMKAIPVPIKTKIWRWIPDGGGTGATVACQANVNPCQTRVQESGTMELTALVNGIEQVDSAHVDDPNGQVKLTPERSRMMFTAVLDPPYIPRHDTSVQMITVSVVDANGTPLTFRTVDLVLAATENTAGHHHVGNATKPAGSVDQASVNTGASGSVQVKFQAPEASGPVVITGTSPGATTGTTSIDVGLFTLAPYGAGQGYTLIGGDTHGGAHFENHFATPKHISDLQKLAARYNTKFGTGLQYNDSSLPWGGLFDFNWEVTPWHTPHGGHRDGVNTDLRIVADDVNHLPALTNAQQNEVRRIWTRLGGQVHEEGDPKHWHLKYPQ